MGDYAEAEYGYAEEASLATSGGVIGVALSSLFFVYWARKVYGVRFGSSSHRVMAFAVMSLVVFFFFLLLTPSSHDNNFYETLEMQRHPSIMPSDIKRAFRQMSKVHHPDRKRDDPNANEYFLNLKQASEILTDARLKLGYERWGPSVARSCAGAPSPCEEDDFFLQGMVELGVYYSLLLLMWLVFTVLISRGSSARKFVFFSVFGAFLFEMYARTSPTDISEFMNVYKTPHENAIFVRLAVAFACATRIAFAMVFRELNPADQKITDLEKEREELKSRVEALEKKNKSLLQERAALENQVKELREKSRR